MPLWHLTAINQKFLVLTGQVSVNTIGDCEAEILLTSRLGARSQTLISGLINYGDDGLNFVKFDPANSEAQNNMLRAVISALQVNKEGALEFGTVSEQTSSGFSNSFYECNCGCDLGAHCTCEDSCGELKITKQSHVAIDADSSSLNPLAERLFTKMMFDTQVDLGSSTCEISHDSGPFSKFDDSLTQFTKRHLKRVSFRNVRNS